MKEWITNYDFRGEWTSQESKDEIRTQINRKIDEFVKQSRLSAIDECMQIFIKAFENNKEFVSVEGRLFHLCGGDDEI